MTNYASGCMRAYIRAEVCDGAVIRRGTNIGVTLINAVNPDVLKGSMCMRSGRSGKGGNNSSSAHSEQLEEKGYVKRKSEGTLT